ncbi:MAG: GDSL-type esterase/lipase family protein [Thermoanaerobaculia bacterium]
MRRLLVAVGVLGGVIAGTAISTHDRASAARNLAEARARLDDGVLRAVVLGDSVARGAGDERGRGIPGALDTELRELGIRAAAVVNLGVNGARTADLQKLLTQTAARSTVRTADILIVSIGGNDLYGDPRARLLATLFPDHRQARTLVRVQRIVGRLREANPGVRICLLGLYNPYRRSAAGAWLDRQVNQWDARLIARFAANRGVTVIRIVDLLQRDDRISALDRFHPGAAGYAAIAGRIASSL